MLAAVETVASYDGGIARRGEPRFARAALTAAIFALSVTRRRRWRHRRSVMHPALPQLERNKRRRNGTTSVATTAAARLGWTEAAKRTLADFSRHRVTTEAAGVTFYSILALFPAIAALVSLYGLFADPATIGTQLNNMSAFLPGGAIQVIGDQMTRVSQQSNGKLGFGLVVGVVIALWSANGGTKSLFDALNTVYGVREERGFVKLNAASLALTLAGIVFMVIAAAAVIVLPGALGFLGLPAIVDAAVRILRWPALLVVVAIGLAVIYRYGPNRREARWRWITAGSAAAAIGWLILSVAFSWYAAHFGSYNATYGSLGAIIGFMMWIWLSAIVILIGAEIDVTLETGRTRPLRSARQ